MTSTSRQTQKAIDVFKFVTCKVSHLHYGAIDRVNFDIEVNRVLELADANGYGHLLRKRIANDPRISAVIAAA